MAAIEISVNQARELTDRIKLGLDTMWEMIKQAWQSEVHLKLGYPSWDDYCTREFGSSRIRIPKESRTEEISSMRAIGMSPSAIEQATGLSRRTVNREISQWANAHPDEGLPPVTGTDGKTYTQPTRPAPKLEPVPDPEPAPEPSLSFDDEPEPPEWKEVGTVPKQRLNNISPPRHEPRPVLGLNAEDLDELNTTSKPTPAAEEVHKPLDEDYYDPKEHLISLMSHLKKASKAVEDAIFAAKHLDSWSQGPVSGDLRTLLDELDETLTSGGFNAELARLLEGEN